MLQTEKSKIVCVCSGQRSSSLTSVLLHGASHRISSTYSASTVLFESTTTIHTGLSMVGQRGATPTPSAHLTVGHGVTLRRT
mmetsp:Transcript_6756/g.15815  ORF Transcript_6756/g.15815 Transcript_6756/m.15815 type:complete len:82 (-) Transcript_6756:673-918(-)